MQTPLFKQLLVVQGVTSQFVPEYPLGHVHVYVSPAIPQVPPLRHGSELHGVTSQVVPENPAGQVHVKESLLILHVPSLIQG